MKNSTIKAVKSWKGFVIYVCFLSVLLYLASITNDYLTERKTQTHPAIIRLVSLDHPSFRNTFCSAFVISDKVAVTAAHCVEKIGDQIAFQNTSEDFLGFATVYSLITRVDQAILIGDFTNFKRFKLKTQTNGIGNSKGPFKNCGYAYGGSLICFDYKNIGIVGFMLRGEGFMYPGMSGGPVFDLTTNEVIGINYAVADSFLVISPIVNLEQMHEIEVK